jgi:hypothetical protein
LESLSGEIEREILGIDDTLDEAQPLGNEIGSIIGDEHATNVELDVVLGLFGLEEIKGSPLGNEKDGTEFKLTLDGKMFDGQMIFPITGKMLADFSKLRRYTYLERDL